MMSEPEEHFLERFLAPQSVAVVGASNNPGRTNYYLVANLIGLGFKGRIYPVNPNEKEVMGLMTFGSVREIPESVDLAVIGVSYTSVMGILEDCVEKGIKRVTIIAGGFSEVGDKGKWIQERMYEIIRKNNIRAIGPNALSPINVKEGFCIAFHPVPRIKEGGLSLVFQSGLYEPRFQWLFSDFNLHLNKLIDLGNKMDISEVDALDYLVRDPETRVIGIHLESIRGDGRKFLGLIREASLRDKRVIILKSGRSKAGARAAASHTGALVLGNDRVFDGALRQCGALRAKGLEDFLDLSRAMERFGPLSMKGNRIFLATFPGGEAVIVTDLCEQEGLQLANLEGKTIQKLRPVFPPWNISPNPWDLGLTIQFHHPAKVYRTMISSAVEDPNVDGLAVQIHPMISSMAKEQLEVFTIAVEAGKPIVLWLAGTESGRHENLVWLEDRGIPVFSSPEKAVRALSALHGLRHNRKIRA